MRIGARFYGRVKIWGGAIQDGPPTSIIFQEFQIIINFMPKISIHCYCQILDDTTI